MRITVVGTGYVGLVTGTCIAEAGQIVTCVDIDEEKIEMMKQGISPIYEVGLEEMMKRNLEVGRLYFTTDYIEAYKNSDVIFIGVGTPEREDRSVNLDNVFTVARQLAENVENDTVVVIKSTVPIGINDKIEEYIKEHLKHDVKIEVASNPEFLAQGTAVKDTLYASRIVIGVESENAEKVLREIYEPFNISIVVTNRRSAEMIKYASNNFLALKISYMNDIANLCEFVGANIEDVAKGMSYDSRIGNKFLNAGIGFGGSCFPKDTKALHWLASKYGYDLNTVKAAIDVNESQKFRLLKKARKIFGSFKGINVAVLGLTFKPGTDDLREAPSIPNITTLFEEGANITVFDPVGMENFKKLYPIEVNYVESASAALKDADVCFVFTEWNEIKEIKPCDFINNMKKYIVLDGRNCYDLSEMKDAGIDYYSVGR